MIYRDKLEIFHDVFISYAWKYIERQILLGYKQPVEILTTPFKDVVLPFTVLAPLKGAVNGASNIAKWVEDLWQGELHDASSIDMNELFASELLVKQMLSRAIQEIAIHVELHLNSLQSKQALGAFATGAVVKLVNYLQNNVLAEGVLTFGDVITAVLKKQDSFFSSDPFFHINLVNRGMTINGTKSYAKEILLLGMERYL